MNYKITVFSLILTSLAAFAIGAGQREAERVLADKIRLSRPINIDHLIELDIYEVSTEEFPRPELLAENIDFWRRIFGEYSSSDYVLHDRRNPSIIYEVLNMDDIYRDAEWGVLTAEESESIKQARLKLALDQYRVLIRELDQKELAEDADHRPLAELWEAAGLEFTPKEAAGAIRFQQGLSDRIAQAYINADPYLERMEKIFTERSLPKELTRIAIVESLFEHDAVSSAGAVGVWQFIEQTGHKFLEISDEVDERYDPIYSTEAAAELLEQNHRMLGSWPLAITAYNHGPAGLRRAVRRIGSRDLGVLAAEYRSRRFGFASANYYSEFLALLELESEGMIDRLKDRYSDRKTTPDLLHKKTRAVRLRRSLGLGKLANSIGLDPDEISMLNPALREPIVAGRVPIPEGNAIRLPEDKYLDAIAAIEADGDAEPSRFQSALPVDYFPLTSDSPRTEKSGSLN